MNVPAMFCLCWESWRATVVVGLTLAYVHVETMKDDSGLLDGKESDYW